eukprot:9402668-Alexandrium_andersonii.AAC.1
MEAGTRGALQAKVFAQLHAVRLPRPVRFTEAAVQQHMLDALSRASSLYQARLRGAQPTPVPRTTATPLVEMPRGPPPPPPCGPASAGAA